MAKFDSRDTSVNMIRGKSFRETPDDIPVHYLSTGIFLLRQVHACEIALRQRDPVVMIAISSPVYFVYAAELRFRPIQMSALQLHACQFTGPNAPTSLDGISVTVNGKPAFVNYVGPGQINVDAPDDTATGLVPIQVKTPLGLSNIVMANRTRV